jgi:hypothetical protein
VWPSRRVVTRLGWTDDGGEGPALAQTRAHQPGSGAPTLLLSGACFPGSDSGYADEPMVAPTSSRSPMDYNAGGYVWPDGPRTHVSDGDDFDERGTRLDETDANVVPGSTTHWWTRRDSEEDGTRPYERDEHDARHARLEYLCVPLCGHRTTLEQALQLPVRLKFTLVSTMACVCYWSKITTSR